MTSLEPADEQWPTLRLERWTPPREARPSVPSPASGSFVSFDAARFDATDPRLGREWKAIPGLGRTGSAMTILPTTAPSIEISRAQENAPRLEYSVEFPRAGDFSLEIYLLPSHPISGRAIRLGIGLDEASPQLVSLDVKDGSREWAQGVLEGVRVTKAQLQVTKPGRHTLRVYGIEAGVDRAARQHTSTIRFFCRLCSGQCLERCRQFEPRRRIRDAHGGEVFVGCSRPGQVDHLNTQ